MYSLRVTITKDNRSIGLSDWTTDKDAVIEALDAINKHRVFDLHAYIGLQEDKIIIIKNGNVLLRFDIFDQAVIFCDEFNYKKCRDLTATVEVTNASDNALKINHEHRL